MIKWAPSSEFVSSSIPSWQISTAHAQPFRGARDLAFCLKVPLNSLLVWASSEGSGETARMRRLAWTFAARIGDKYQIRLTRSIYWMLQKCFRTRENSKFSFLAPPVNMTSSCLGDIYDGWVNTKSQKITLGWDIQYLAISGTTLVCLLFWCIDEIECHNHKPQSIGRHAVIYCWQLQGCASVLVYSIYQCLSAFCLYMTFCSL